MSSYLFTSESVSEGHPDKIADQISDAVLDEILKQDPKARVACETYVKTGMALVGGECWRYTIVYSVIAFYPRIHKTISMIFLIQLISYFFQLSGKKVLV